MYRLGGETDSATDEENELVWRRRDVQRKLVVKNFSQTFVKNAFYFCEFGCYNKKLCVNKPIIFFS